jgi:hypothetical protein
LFTSPLNRLRQSTWLAAVPDTLTVPEIGDRPTRSLSIERATVDDVALALVALNAQHAALCRLSTALKEVHDLARKQGALGEDNAVAAAARQLGEKQ